MSGEIRNRRSAVSPIEIHSEDVMLGWQMLAVWAFMAVVMAAAWLAQRRAGDSGWIDVFWTFGTGVAGVACALWPDPGASLIRPSLVAVLVAIWSVRLGTHIALRVADGPEDSRYSRLRQDWGRAYQRRLFAFVQVQAPASVVLCLSIALAAHNPAPGFRLQDGLAVLILAVAIAGEGLADAQLAALRRDPANSGGVNDRGLWAWSRHPNYFFEWLGWVAYPLMAIDPARPLSFASLAGPAAMYLILTRLTGAPYLEAHMAQSRGAAWDAYARRTSPFFPVPPRRARS
jgi:steroid 5-alpha reductase family enzyme